jgi:hypothetical protein
MGKEYKVGGKLIELFTVGDLASAIGRDPQTPRKWELHGVIPRAALRDRAGRRLYCKEEINSLVKILVEEDVKTGSPIASTKFKERVLKEWAEIRKRIHKGATKCE